MYAVLDNVGFGNYDNFRCASPVGSRSTLHPNRVATFPLPKFQTQLQQHSAGLCRHSFLYTFKSRHGLRQNRKPHSTLLRREERDIHWIMSCAAALLPTSTIGRSGAQAPNFFHCLVRIGREETLVLCFVRRLLHCYSGESWRLKRNQCTG
jgi:hypothetical protein